VAREAWFDFSNLVSTRDRHIDRGSNDIDTQAPDAAMLAGADVIGALGGLSDAEIKKAPSWGLFPLAQQQNQKDQRQRNSEQP
jgi:hypothetical protein